MQRCTRFTTTLIAALVAAGLTGTVAAFGALEIATITLSAGAADRETDPVPPRQPTSSDGTLADPTADPTAVGAVDGTGSGTDTGVDIGADTGVGDAGPEPLLVLGDRGVRVRALQHRLSQIAWYLPPVTGSFDKPTVRAVRGFQNKRGLEVTGAVDVRSWKRLLRMTRTPTRDELFDRAGPALLAAGGAGPEVRALQARLRQIGWFSGNVGDAYDERTVTAVRGFQAKRTIPVTGEVDRRTLDLLLGMTYEPTADQLANRAPDPADGSALDPRCLTGRTLCVDKSSNSLRWVVDGAVLTTVDVRFGSDELPTREGQFAVSYKSRDHVSSLYDTSMPFAMFFSGGQAVHYSPDFAANGYSGASHGCVNVRDYGAIASLYEQVDIGDKVVVYWS